jgi:hypothetical protein
MWKGLWCGIARGWWPQVWPPRGSGGGELTRLARSQDGEGGWHPACAAILTDITGRVRPPSPRQRLLGLQRYRGYSDLRALTQMAQLDTPLASGTVFGRLELVDMDAGEICRTPLTGRSSVPARPGTVAGRAPAGGFTWRQAGSGGPGRSIWDHAPRFRGGGLGRGATLTGDWHMPVGMTLSRRPVSSAPPGGTVDPGTGISWGGVANGVRLISAGIWEGSRVLGQRPAAPADRQERARQLAHPAHGGAITSSSTRPIAVPAWGSAPCCGTTSRIWGLYPGAGGYYSPQGTSRSRCRSATGSVPRTGRGWGDRDPGLRRTDDSRRYPLKACCQAVCQTEMRL